MYILGLNLAHDSSAALVRDGLIIAAAEEERFIKKKHTNSFPYNSIRFCLEKAQIKIHDIDYVACSWVPWRGILHNSSIILKDLIKSKPIFSVRINRGNEYLKETIKIFFAKNYLQKLSHQKKISLKIRFIEHHMAHAAGAFFVSPFKEAAILTIDGMGEKTTTLFAKGKYKKIIQLDKILYPHSLGNLYSIFTEFLGFKALSDEGKVMGLASYGNKEKYKLKFNKLLSIDDHGFFKVNFDLTAHQASYGNNSIKDIISLFGPPRKLGDKITQHYCDIAAGLQYIIEKVGIKLAKHLYNLTKSKNLCLSGGVALNSVMNHKILNETPFENIYIQPASNDAGTSVGAALYLYHQKSKGRLAKQETDVYLGPEYGNDQIEKSLKDFKLNYSFCRNPTKEAAKKIAKSKIIGWFHGRMEFGPRALGNRSILADPRIPEMKDVLNKNIKFRESFRPFAPSVLAEDYNSFFKISTLSPNMLLIADVIKKKRNKIPAVTHVDGTARLQTVEKNTNKLFWELISEFKDLTGIPVILNTSLNVRGDPIAENPEDAIKTFLKTGMDYLFIGNFIVDKKKNL